MKKLNELVSKLELEIKLLHSSNYHLVEEWQFRRISREDYEFHKELRSDEDKKFAYLREVENKLKLAKEKLKEQKLEQKYQEKKPGLTLAMVMILIMGAMFLTNYDGITGFLTFSDEQTFVQNVSLNYTDDGIYELDLENITSLRISGAIYGEGRARVILDINGTYFTVMDQYTPEKEIPALITGLVTGEEENLTEVVENITKTIENTTEEEPVIENATEEVVVEENITIEENVSVNVTENVSVNITENITIEENLTENITTNITENITIEENITENITINVTENISINISENITINITENVTINVSENVTVNITENVTANITENETEGGDTGGVIIDQNDTVNVSENITINISENMTELPVLNISETNITIEENETINVTENVTENITVEPMIFYFENQCLETCNLKIPNGRLIIDLRDVNLTIDQIIYTKGAAVNETANETINVTENVTPSNLTQFAAEIGKPVKWNKLVKADENGTATTMLPETSFNITVTEEDTKEKVDKDKLSILENETKIKLDKYEQQKAELSELRNENISKKDKDKKDIELVIEHTAPKYIVEYETPAPELTEEIISENNKIVTISSNLHYENVLTYTDITPAKQSKIKLYWIQNESRELFTNITYIDANNDGLIEKIEWTVPHLSNQTFQVIIEITSAEHLDSNREFISDIYNETYQQDDIWSETIPANDYVRVTFESLLDSSRDITIVPRIVSGNPTVEVYEINGTTLIAEFTNITENEYNKKYLTELQGEQDTFDLLILDGDIQFDLIIDPDQIDYTDFWTTAANWEGWTDGGAACYLSSATSNCGSGGSVEIVGNAASAKFYKTFDLSGYAEIRINFDVYAYSIDAGECVYFKVDGTSVRSFGEGTGVCTVDVNVGSWDSHVIYFSCGGAITCDSSVVLQFESEASDTIEGFYIDCIEVTGSECDDNADCGTCEKCSGGDCVVQTAAEDLKDECAAAWNTCTGSGSPYKCSRTGADGLCDGAGACDTNDASENIASGYVCTGSGAETAGSTTYYASVDSDDRCSNSANPDVGLGNPTHDVFACDGSGGVSGPDVGNEQTACTGCCYDAGETASCIAAPSYGTYNFYNFGVGDGTTDYCVADANLDDCYDENDCNSASGYYCSGSNACINTCTENADCLSGWYCPSAGTCAAVLADGSSCVGITATSTSAEEDGACSSGYCDNDGEGAADDNWCYTPSSTLYDGQEATKCEYDTGAAVDIFADEQAVLYTYNNKASASAYYGCPAYSSCKIASSPACQAYDGDGTSAICSSLGTW
ncbi:MAG: hypothetical protein ABH828_01070, partial [archaeon]